MKFATLRTHSRREDSGYMLLVLMLAVAVLTITMLGVARNYRRAIQRDREVEMIHRGEQYARAIKRFYAKNKRYPTTLEQLEDTNKVRFLRKRYKDPMSPDGEWKIAHATDIKLPGVAGGTAVTNPQSASGILGSTTLGSSGTGTLSNPLSPSSNTESSTTGTGGGQATSAGTTTATGESSTEKQSSSSGDSSTSATGSGNATNQVLGGGDILGVVSKMKTEGIHTFGDKSKYNEWFFIYLPTQDTGKGLITGPYNPKMFVGSANSNLGTKSGAGTTTGPTNSPQTSPATTTTNP